MKILILNWRDIMHPWAGGAERHIHELAKRWVKKGHKVTLLVGGYDGALKREIIDGIEIVRKGGNFSILLWAPFIYLLYLRKGNFDYIVEISRGIPFFAKLFSRKKILLLIHHNHKKVWKTEFPPLIAYLGIFLENIVTPFVYKNTLVVTLSSKTITDLKRIGFKSVIAIKPGLDLKFYARNIKKTKNQSILYVGRLRRYKRVEILLNIFPNIKKKFPNLTLTIVGVGQDKARLEHMARVKKIDKQVEFKGFVSEEEKVMLLAKSWVLAFPSIVEGWGLVAIEAAACGTPTVGFNVPGVSDAISLGKSGLLAKTKKDFENMIFIILKDKLLRKKLSLGSVKWSQQFDWDYCANQFIQIFNKL